MATNLVAKMGQNYLPPCNYRSAIPKRNGISQPQYGVNSVNDASILCENFMKFSPATPELTLLICERQLRHGQKTGHFSRVSPDILDRFSESFYHMKALYEHMMISVPYFLICQGSLPWQPNNVAKTLSTPTDTSCIHCTDARKRIAISWSS